jgi:GNAT superfamily N-acetyltransferase
MPVRYHPVLHVTASLAQRVERAEIEFCAAAGGRGDERIASLDAGGGRALYSKPGSPLNKVLGLGLGAAVTDADLDAIENFYTSHGAPVRIELCPLAPADVAQRLSARGFVLQEFENELVRSLPADDIADVPGVRTLTAPAAQDDLWVEVVANGFAAAEGEQAVTAQTLVEQLGAVMRHFTHQQITRYLVWIDGEPAGGGATFESDGIVGVFGTATLPRFRRRGVQTSLVRTALRDAAPRAELAIATVQPGSTSQRTFERLGFHVMYTRAILVNG